MDNPGFIERWRRRLRPAPDAGALFNISWLASKPRDANESQIRALTKAVALAHDEALCRVLGRYKMYLPTDDIHIAPHLMIDGYWEMWLTEQLVRYVRPGMKVADIGANLGYFSILMADLVGPTGKVTAVEPIPRMANLLRRSAWANGWQERIELVSEPLSDVSGRPVQLAFHRDSPGGAAIYDSAPAQFGEVLELTTVALDDLPALHDLELIKIDVEGSEDRVWAGMGALLRGTRLKTVFLEYCGARYADPERFLHDLTAPGFRLHVLDLTSGLVAVSAREILALPPLREITLALLRD